MKKISAMSEVFSAAGKARSSFTISQRPKKKARGTLHHKRSII